MRRRTPYSQKGDPVLVVAGIAIMIGAFAQRVSGMGFALVAAPILILLLGPFEGVLLVNAGGALSSMVVFLQTRKGVNWREYGLLIGPALLAVIPGALITLYLDRTVLQIVLGILLIVALVSSLVVARQPREMNLTLLRTVFGAASGFMSATIGVGGPAVGIYGILRRWEQGEFSATLQPYFMTLGASSFLAKFALSGSLPSVDPWMWPAMVVCTLAGLALGTRLKPLVPAPLARTIVIGVCLAGAVSTLVDAFLNL